MDTRREMIAHPPVFIQQNSIGIVPQTLSIHTMTFSWLIKSDGCLVESGKANVQVELQYLFSVAPEERPASF